MHSSRKECEDSVFSRGWFRIRCVPILLASQLMCRVDTSSLERRVCSSLIGAYKVYIVSHDPFLNLTKSFCTELLLSTSLYINATRENESQNILN